MDRLNAAKAMRRGQWHEAQFVAEALLDQAPIEVRAAFDMAMERADFVRAADVIEHEWLETRK